MSVVLANTPVSTANRPTTALQQALVDFEAILTVDERQRLHTGAVVPAATSVLDFVGQIDSNNRSRGGRCVAQRLCKFLDSLQQFTGIVDTFVSANPTIAALVWGGVKMTILTASNVASFFDKVTDMIMEIGKYCPIFRQFGALYPGHVGVQEALCNYYAIVIRVCIKVISNSRKTSLMHTVSSMFLSFETEFNPLLDELKQASKIINLQVSLASKENAQRMLQLQEKESKQSQFYQRVALKFQDEAKREHEEARQWRLQQAQRNINELRTSIKDNLSTVDHLKPWKQAIRQIVPGTGQWIVQETEFREWRASPAIQTLWCSGKMGSGKTVLASQVVSHLHSSRQKGEVISFYFCRKDDETSLTSRAVLGSITRQLLDVQIENLDAEALQKLQTISKSAEAQDLVRLLADSLKKDISYFIILDGLDECDDDAIKTVVDCLDQIQKANLSIHVKLLFTGRAELESRLSRRLTLQHKVVLSKERVNNDINVALNALIQQKIDEGFLKLRDVSLKSLIADRLRQESDGIFLWVILVLEEICSRNSDYGILEALDSLPRGLSQLLDQKVARIRQHPESAEAAKLLACTAVVKRPLTIKECQEALSITPDQRSLDPRKFVNDMNAVVAGCRGLLFIDEEELTIHYIHQSIPAYLFKDENSSLEYGNLTTADQYLGQLCMTYLGFSNFGRRVAKIQQAPKSSNDAIDIGLATLNENRGVASKVAQKFLLRQRKSQRPTKTTIELTVQGVLDHVESERLKSEVASQYHFYDYAKVFWYQHLTCLKKSPQDMKPWSLFCKLLWDREVVAERPWPAFSPLHNTDDLPWTVPLAKWAIEHDHAAMLRYVLSVKPQWEHPRVIRTMFSLSIEHNSRTVLQALEDYGLTNTVDINNALVLAAADGDETRLIKVVNAGADVNSRFMPSHIFGRNNTDVRDDPPLDKVLVTLGKDVFPRESWVWAGYSALAASAKMNLHPMFLGAVELLIELGADVNISGNYDVEEKIESHRPLYEAVLAGRRETAKTLIEAGADVNALSHHGSTALLAATKLGKSDILKDLLEADADPNLVSQGMMPPLLNALNLEPNYDIVKTLLDGGAYPNTSCTGFQAPLHVAVEKGDSTSVKRLLAAGAHPDIRGTSEQPALHTAITKRKRDIAKQLIAAGADVNLFGEDFSVPLMVAIRLQDSDMVEILINAGADLNIRIGMDGHTPLQEAMWSGYITIIRLLVDAGAEVERNDVFYLWNVIGAMPPEVNLVGTLASAH